MYGLFFMTCIYLIPLSAIVFFIASLCGYIKAAKLYKAEPDELNKQKKSTTKTLLIVSSVIVGILLIVVICFMALMYTAVTYM